MILTRSDHQAGRKRLQSRLATRVHRRGAPLRYVVMGEQHPLGTMADPRELLRALKALGLIELPTPAEQARAEQVSGGRALWRLECAHHLAGAAETQVLMAGGAAADAGHGSTPILWAGWEFYGGAGMADDAARVGLLVAMTRRLAEHIMVMVARKQRGDGDELLSPLVNPALPVVEALAGLLQAAAVETSGADEPRAGLPQVIDQLRSMADLLETMTPREYLQSADRK
jgi:hypothetical protein